MADDVKDFEGKMRRIGEIVTVLEKGGIPLDESLALYEEGMAAVKSCMEALKNARLRIEKLSADGVLTEASEAESVEKR